jgi:hypothetical protein
MSKEMKWFGIKRLYEWRSKRTSKSTLIEERVVIVAARDWDSAYRKADREARAYCKPETGYGVIALSQRYTGYLMDPLTLDPIEVIEVYSWLHRNVPLRDKRKYIQHHLKTSPPKQ